MNKIQPLEAARQIGMDAVPEEWFPHVLRIFRESTGEELWSFRVEHADDTVTIPELDARGGPYRIRIEYPDGDVFDEVVPGGP